MVEDPNTNSIICWSPSGTSFIIWDHIRFSFELLLKYFKHTNMSGFIYQLNNYEFKKTGLQTWEYENYWFQAEKKHLLTNIKQRRNKSLKKDFNEETYYYGVEEELRSQRDLNDMLKLEIKKLKERQDDMTNGIASLKEYLENSEAESRKLLCFPAKKVKQVAIKHGMKCGAEDKIESSSKSSGKTKIDDFSSITSTRYRAEA